MLPKILQEKDLINILVLENDYRHFQFLKLTMILTLPYIIFWVMETKIKVKLQLPSQAQYFYLLRFFFGGEDEKGIRKRGKTQRKGTSVNMNIKTTNKHGQVHFSKNTELSKRMWLLTLPSKSSSKEQPWCDCWYFSWKSFPSNTSQGIKSSILNGKPQALLAMSKVVRPRTKTAPRCTPLESTCASC